MSKTAKGKWTLGVIAIIVIAIPFLLTLLILLSESESVSVESEKRITKPQLPPRYLSGTIDIPAGKGIYSTELKPQKGERWLFKSLSDRKAVLWDSRGKKIAIPHGGKVLICSKISGAEVIEFVKQEQKTRVVYNKTAQ